MSPWAPESLWTLKSSTSLHTRFEHSRPVVRKFLVDTVPGWHPFRVQWLGEIWPRAPLSSSTFPCSGDSINIVQFCLDVPQLACKFFSFRGEALLLILSSAKCWYPVFAGFASICQDVRQSYILQTNSRFKYRGFHLTRTDIHLKFYHHFGGDFCADQRAQVSSRLPLISR